MHSCLNILIFDNLLYACCFCSIEILYNANKWQCSSLCFTDSTVVQILAVYVLLPSSGSVGTHCICANVYNAQHGHVRTQRGDRGSAPPGKSQVICLSIANSIWTPWKSWTSWKILDPLLILGKVKFSL